MKGKAFGGFLLLAAAVVLVGNGAGLATASAKGLPGNGSPAAAKSTSFACLTPLTAATGGLCCPGTQTSTAPCVASTPGVVSAAEKRLKPLVVNGVQIPLPIALQIVKKALKRKWSLSLAARNVLVCDFRQIAGSHMSVLHCNTNSVHFRGFIQANFHVKASDRKVHCYYNCFLTWENIVTALIRYVNADPGRANVLGSLLGKAPAASATYSLRVPETVPMRFPKQHLFVNFPAYVTFVMGRGHLSDIELTRRKGTAKMVKHLSRHKQSRDRVYVGNKSNGNILCTASNLTC